MALSLDTTPYALIMRASAAVRLTALMISAFAVSLLLLIATEPSPVHAAYPTGGGIGKVYKSLGGSSGRLGPATGSEHCTLIQNGCYQSFRNGSIHWTKTTGAHATWGAIRTAWKKSGWEKGALGYPTSNEYKSGSETRQSFQKGRITWSSSRGAAVILAKATASFSLKGAGYGHGVGLSQYGARGMAVQGKSATQILEHYYDPAQVTSTTKSANANLKVQLVAGKQSVTVTPSAGRLRVHVGSKKIESSQKITVERTSAGTVKVSVNGKSYQSSWISVEWQGTRYWTGSQKTTVAVSSAQNGSTGTYRHGKLEIRQLSKALNVLGVLRVNSEYLPGIAEMPASWQKGALRAQAIASRTYAYRNLGSLKSACACNVYDEVTSQRFLGWSHENASGSSPWRQAVAATQNVSGSSVKSAKVVTYKGSLINAVYSPSSGGKTNSAAEVWGSSVPYLKSRDDSVAKSKAAGNPYASWTATLKQSTAANAFGLKDVRTIVVTRTGSGLVKTAKATSTNGQTSSLTGAQLRSKLGLRSATFTVS